MLCVLLQEMRDRNKLTNKDLVERSGLSPATVNRVMTGQTDAPAYQTVCDLVMAMGGSLDELAGIIHPAEKEGVPEPVAVLTPDTELLGVLKKVIAAKNETIAKMEVWLRRLFGISCALLVILLAVLIIDWANPHIGFIVR